jgi:hypothetical protein
MPDGRVEITGLLVNDDPLEITQDTNDSIFHLVIKQSETQNVIVTDCRTLTESAQYNIGWHDGYRAQHNEKANAEYIDKDKRMIESFNKVIDEASGGNNAT